MQNGASKKFKKFKKVVIKAGIKPRIVNNLQLREFGKQNTTAIYPWFW